MSVHKKQQIQIFYALMSVKNLQKSEKIAGFENNIALYQRKCGKICKLIVVGISK